MTAALTLVELSQSYLCFTITMNEQIKPEDEESAPSSEVVAGVPWNHSEPEFDRDRKEKDELQQETNRDGKHSCQICGKEFSTQSCLRQHIKKHHGGGGGVRRYKCTYCWKRFAFRNPLIVHLRTHTKEKPFFCPLCGTNFSLMSHVKCHMEMHTEKTSGITSVQQEEEAVGGLINLDGELEWDPTSSGATPNVHPNGDEQLDGSMDCFSCQECSMEFLNLRALSQHQSSHTGAKPHKCSKCGKGFSHLNRLKRHYLVHTREKSFPCSMCDKRFSRKDKLKDHLNTHRWSAEALDQEETLVTSDGALTESNRKSPDVTLPDDAAEHAKPEPTKSPRKCQRRAEAEELFSCADCSKEFQSIYGRDRHMREKHGKHLLHKCCDCGKALKSSRSLILHRRIYHPAPGVAMEPQEKHRVPKKYLCSTCGKEFPTSASLNRHLIIHSGRKPYTCNLCGRGFTQTGNLKTHLKVHKAEKSIHVPETSPEPERSQSSVEICFCHLCCTQFSDKHLLEKHFKQVHEAKKPFACRECGKRFTHIQRLREHQAGHEGLKPHKCSQCDKSFQTSKGLENHTRDHTGEKPFPCILCGKRFKQESTLRAHYLSHSGERPHLCSVCGKRYARAEELKVHLRVHTGEKPYQCDECGKSFYYRQGFNNHKKTHSAKPIGPTRQLGRPRQPGSPRRAAGPKKVLQVTLSDSDGEGLVWDPPDLGDEPDHNQENHTAANHSQIWNFGHYMPFNLWDQNPNSSNWRATEGHQFHCGPAGASVNLSALLRGSPDNEHFQQSCPAEQPSWPSAPSCAAPLLPSHLSPPHPHNTAPKKSHLSRRGDANHQDEQRPATRDHDHSAGPTDRFDGETGNSTAAVDEPASHEPLHTDQPTRPNQFQRPRKPRKNYDCPTCGKVFTHNTALRRHLVIHSGKRPFKCFVCGKGFTQSGNLKTHLKTHKELPSWTLVQETSPPEESPVTVHVCGECGMDFPQKEQLEEHRMTHKKPYECTDCGKSFKNEYYFKVHKRLHSGESPFLCSECGKSCVTADSLKKHELTHTGERNFRCDECGRAFTQSSHLTVHLKTHTGVRPHLCSVCGKSYFKACDLKVHLRVHTGEKPYACEKCGKCFYYCQGYRAHLKTHDKKPKQPTKPLGRPRQQPLTAKD